MFLPQLVEIGGRHAQVVCSSRFHKCIENGRTMMVAPVYEDCTVVLVLVGQTNSAHKHVLINTLFDQDNSICIHVQTASTVTSLRRRFGILGATSSQNKSMAKIWLKRYVDSIDNWVGLTRLLHQAEVHVLEPTFLVSF